MKTTTSILAIATIALFSISCKEKATVSTETPAAAATASTDTYPLKTCVVSGEELGDMGDPVVIVHEGTTVKFCCKKCIPKFNKDPEKYIAMIKEAKGK